MAVIAGASAYLSASLVANKLQLSPSIPSLLGNSTTSILSAGRGLAIRGFGLSQGAREMNEQFLNRSSQVNEMFSLGLGSTATVDGSAQAIRALRSTLPETSLAPSLRGNRFDNQA